MRQKIIFVLIPVLVVITVFSFNFQDSFAETRMECRSMVMNDKSLTPVERHYALKTCDPQKTESSFQKYYTEELHNECTRTLKEKTHLNPITRLNDLKECSKLQKHDSSSTAQKLTKFSRTTIEFCDEKYEIYLLVGAKKMWNQAGGKTVNCLKLYEAPMWNSTASDRKIQLQSFLLEQEKQSVDEAEDLRQKGIEEAQLRKPVLLHLKPLFEEQKEEIQLMEQQLQEKNMILDYSKQSFFNEKYEDCSRIIYDKTMLTGEKVYALDKCLNAESSTITFEDEVILEHSKNLVRLCEQSYEIFLNLSIENYYASMNNPLANECVELYKNPIWEYNESNRIQVIEEFVYDKTLKDNYDYLDRINSVTDANLSSGMLLTLSDLYQYQKQKIEILEDFLMQDN
ncbi:hypothetical protein [Nitrosopumilus adriaticus]|uniref:hypothetical protein n=1 Tax=Nitrosopumilus adriaticus TaxID=1580092 RepID=UPI00352D0B61